MLIRLPPFGVMVLAMLLSACTLSPWYKVQNTAVETIDVNQSADVTHGNYWQITLRYPLLKATEAALANELREQGREARREFLAALPPQEERTRVFELQLDFTVTSRVGPLVSVRGEGFSDTGGAHPLPIDTAFVYDVSQQRQLQLADLFTDLPAALKVLSDTARTRLTPRLLTFPADDQSAPEAKQEWLANMQEMLDDGTQPQAGNFANLLVTAQDENTASGLVLVFPPYQVAPYVNGTQTVAVPAAALHGLLRPVWQALFQGH